MVVWMLALTDTNLLFSLQLSMVYISTSVGAYASKMGW